MTMYSLGIVIIGRNEGERLRACIKSAINATEAVVYVDSGSTDNSVELAKELGAEIVGLDLSIPFTAARARNAGFDHLISHYPSLTYVQFIDGDCELVENWLQQGIGFLNTNTQFAVVCGRRRERFPNASIYNLICDIEWDTAIGEAKSCGGDALMRVDALQSVNGFNDSLIAGEEPELCARLRQSGWRISRINAEMTLHDAAIKYFSQWWKRCKRTGYGITAGCLMDGLIRDYWLKQAKSIIIWGCILPLFIFLGCFYSLFFLIVLAVYPAQAMRIAIFKTHRIRSSYHKGIYGFFVILSKFPQLYGMLHFIVDKYQKRKAVIIEYK
ncbi:MAG: glycosyltransferase [Methylovulum sp.]|nr:glycosyltransferase [Methylovulum sp.]MCF8007155.1 glycosyltransferase [Methylovulum sp.]